MLGALAGVEGGCEGFALLHGAAVLEGGDLLGSAVVGEDKEFGVGGLGLASEVADEEGGDDEDVEVFHGEEVFGGFGVAGEIDSESVPFDEVGVVLGAPLVGCLEGVYDDVFVRHPGLERDGFAAPELVEDFRGGDDGVVELPEAAAAPMIRVAVGDETQAVLDRLDVLHPVLHKPESARTVGEVGQEGGRPIGDAEGHVADEAYIETV